MSASDQTVSGGMRPRPKRRRRLKQAIAEMHFQLRSGTHTPFQTGASVFLGTLIGATPLFGLHLPICIALASALRLSRIKSYLAAHINNPLTLPFLLYVQTGIGHWIFNGVWLPPSIAALRSEGLLAVGRDLIVGSLVFGVVAGLILGAIAWAVAFRFRHVPPTAALREATARKYLDSGIFDWEYVRGKLAHDPIYFGLLGSGVLPVEGSLVDLGCGRGIVLSLLAGAGQVHQDGNWPAGWPEPPRLELTGVEARPEIVEVARQVLRGEAEIVEANLLDYRLEAADVVLLLDVLHYLPKERQQGLLAEVAGQLAPGGLLLIREPAAERGWRFFFTRAGERACALGRRHWRQAFHYRSSEDWTRLLEELGLTVSSRPMWSGTPFANVLIQARKRTDDD